MYICSHLSAGYIAGKATRASGYTMSLWLAGSLLPDIDGLWSSSVAGHHSFPHSPFFWLCLIILSFLLPKKSALKYGIFIVSISAFIHLFTDWFTARTTGIQLLYPWSLFDYSLFPINPDKGNIPIINMLGWEYFSFYLDNIFLFIFEFSINIFAFILLCSSYNRKKYI